MARTYLKEWRQKRGLTQEQVIGRLLEMDDPHLPVTAASLSRLENGKQIYTQRSLEALAAIYEVDSDELLRPPPDEAYETLQREVSKLNDLSRRRALLLLRALNAAEAEEVAESRADTA